MSDDPSDTAEISTQLEAAIAARDEALARADRAEQQLARLIGRVRVAAAALEEQFDTPAEIARLLRWSADHPDFVHEMREWLARAKHVQGTR